MAYKKFNIYGGINISEKAVTIAIIIGLVALAAVMVIGNRVGFTASFESNGAIIEEQHLHYGDRISEPPAPARDGYVFTGWYSDTARTQRYDFSRNDLSDDITLYAAWKRSDAKAGTKPINYDSKSSVIK